VSTIDVAIALMLAGIVIWQLAVGYALGTWWRPRIYRQDNPGTYWLVVALQIAIVVYLVIFGTSTWHYR
jgi:hypothetical protein